jgi:hypothetical protein
MRRATTFLIAVVAYLGVTAPPALAWEVVTGPPKVVKAKISAFEPSGGKTVRIQVDTGYCVGEPQPRIDHLRIVEHGKAPGKPFGSVLLTAFVVYPAPREARGEVLPGEKVFTCAGIGLNLFKRYGLKRPTKGLVVLDGSSAPPRRVPIRELIDKWQSSRWFQPRI